MMQAWFDRWPMTYLATNRQGKVLDSLSQGIAAHAVATDRAIIIFNTGPTSSEDTPQVIFLLEQIKGEWWWTATLLAMFDVME